MNQKEIEDGIARDKALIEENESLFWFTYCDRCEVITEEAKQGMVGGAAHSSLAAQHKKRTGGEHRAWAHITKDQASINKGKFANYKKVQADFFTRRRK